MTTHESSARVDAPADALFAYLEDVANLPEYLPRMTSAHRSGDEEAAVTATLDEGGGSTREVEGTAHFEVDRAARTLGWSSEGDRGYGGEIVVEQDTDAASTVRVRLTFHRGDPQDVDADLDRTVQKIKTLVEDRGRA